MRHVPLVAILATLAAATSALAQNPPPAGAPPEAQAGEGTTPQGPAARRAPRPYAQVITARAHTERGAITAHKVDDRYFLEVADSVLGRDWLLVSRISGVPAGTGGFQFAGSSV